MEKAPGSSEAPQEESKKPPFVTAEERDAADFRDQLQAFFERSGQKELADTVGAESKDQAAKAQERFDDLSTQIAEQRQEIDRINEAVQRGEVIYGENPGDRVEKAEARIRELEDQRAGREKSDVIELTEDMVVPEKEASSKKTRDKYDKTLEDDKDAEPEQSVEKKERPEDPLKNARPKVREALERAGMRLAATIGERGGFALGEKIFGLYERLAEYPSLRRERAQKEADQWEKSLYENRLAQKAYGRDTEKARALHTEEDRLVEGLNNARLVLGRVENEDARFQKRKRSFENITRTIAAEGLKQIDGRLAPFERELGAARMKIERTGKTIDSLNRRVDGFREGLAQKRQALRAVADPMERRKMEADIERLERLAKEGLSRVDRVIKRRVGAQEILEQNEDIVRPLRMRQRRFARVAGVDMESDVITKAPPPENLPVAPKESRGKVVDLAERRAAKQKEGVSPDAVSKLVRAWNYRSDARIADFPRWNLRISDGESFRRMFGDEKNITPEEFGKAVERYFERKYSGKNKILSDSKREKLRRRAEAAAESVITKILKKKAS